MPELEIIDLADLRLSELNPRATPPGDAEVAALAGPEAELARRLQRGVLRHREAALRRESAALEVLEEDVERHHLGERGGEAPGVGVPLVEHPAGRGVDHDRGVFRVVLGDARRRRGRVDGYGGGRRREGHHRAPEEGREAEAETSTLTIHLRVPAIERVPLDGTAASAAGRPRSRTGRWDRSHRQPG